MRAALAMWHDHLRTLVAGGKRKVISTRRTLRLDAERGRVVI